MSQHNFRLGALLMSGAMAVFAAQDGISRYLSDLYSVQTVLMIRFWFYAGFVLVLAARQPGGIKACMRSKKPLFQCFRALLLVLEIYVTVLAFVLLGLINTHVIFASYPLMIAILSGPILGEKLGWRRWSAVALGFIGILIILQPGFNVFSPLALIPLLAAFLFAIYGLATRYVANFDDAMTSFFWTGIIGALGATLAGIWSWKPIAPPDLPWLALLCVTSVAGHYLLIKTYEIAEVSSVQPFAYLQLVFITIIAITVFGETLTFPLIIGSSIVVSSGLFTLWRTQKVKQ